MIDERRAGLLGLQEVHVGLERRAGSQGIRRPSAEILEQLRHSLA